MCPTWTRVLESNQPTGICIPGYKPSRPRENLSPVAESLQFQHMAVIKKRPGHDLRDRDSATEPKNLALKMLRLEALSGCMPGSFYRVTLLTYMFHTLQDLPK